MTLFCLILSMIYTCTIVYFLDSLLAWVKLSGVGLNTTPLWSPTLPIVLLITCFTHRNHSSTSWYWKIGSLFCIAVWLLMYILTRYTYDSTQCNDSYFFLTRNITTNACHFACTLLFFWRLSFRSWDATQSLIPILLTLFDETQ